LITGGVPSRGVVKPLVDEDEAQSPSSARILSYVAGVIRRHRVKIGWCWRKLNAGRPVHPRPGTVLEGWPT
jgi:hypothetical protein